MSESVPDIWTTRDFPILRELALLEEREGVMNPRWEVAAQGAVPNLDEDAISKAVIRLIDAGYIKGQVGRFMGGAPPWPNPMELTERGRRTVGLWPNDDLASRFVAALEAAREAAPEEEHPKYNRLLEVAQQVGTGVVTSVLTTMATRQLGGP